MVEEKCENSRQVLLLASQFNACFKWSPMRCDNSWIGEKWCWFIKFADGQLLFRFIETYFLSGWRRIVIISIERSSMQHWRIECTKTPNVVDIIISISIELVEWLPAIDAVVPIPFFFFLSKRLFSVLPDVWRLLWNCIGRKHLLVIPPERTLNQFGNFNASL